MKRSSLHGKVTHTPYIRAVEKLTLAVQRIAFLEGLLKQHGIDAGPTPFPRAEYLHHQPEPAPLAKSVLAGFKIE